MGFIQPPETFPEFQKADENSFLIERGENEERRSNQKAVVQLWGRILAPHDATLGQYLWALLRELRPPPRWRKVASGCLEPCPVISPPANQDRVTQRQPTPHPPILPVETSQRNRQGAPAFGSAATTVLAWPCNRPSSAPNTDVSVCLASLCVGHVNLSSVTKSEETRSAPCQPSLPWTTVSRYRFDCCTNCERKFIFYGRISKV